jgi:hypothetical protein
MAYCRTCKKDRVASKWVCAGPDSRDMWYFFAGPLLTWLFDGARHRVCVKCGTKVAGFFGEVKKPKGAVHRVTSSR